MSETLFNATITITEYPKMQMFLREHVAYGKLPNGEEFEVMRDVGSATTIIKFADKRTYHIAVQELVDAVLVKRNSEAAAATE